MQNELSNRAPSALCLVEQDMDKTPARYHEIVEKIRHTKEGFAQRLFELRSAKGVSAREMSLSLGQGSGYISNIENRHNLPSMTQFFAICEYLGITPSTFFAFDTAEEGTLAELTVIASTLSAEDVDLMLKIARKLK